MAKPVRYFLCPGCEVVLQARLPFPTDRGICPECGALMRVGEGERVELIDLGDVRHAKLVRGERVTAEASKADENAGDA